MPLLTIKEWTIRYRGPALLDEVSCNVERKQRIGLLGRNGAGKTTLMRALTGVLRSQPEMVRLDGQAIGALGADEIMPLGLAMVPEGRKLFPSLTVEENLLIGTYGRKTNGFWSLEAVYDLFPILKERRHNPGTALSGGQQQMVAIGRALMSNPKVLLCDEISLGLAPVVIKDIYAAVPKIQDSGASLIVVEQDIGQAMKVADRVCCMMEGRITLDGRPDTLSREDIHAAYFGASA